MDKQSLLRTADIDFDEGKYAEAVEKYRAAALLEAPDEFLLHDIQLSGHFEHLKFIRLLIEKYPESFELQFAEVVLIASQNPEAALPHYIKLFDRFGDNRYISVNLWFNRMKIAILAGRYDIVQEDFLTLWPLVETKEPHKRSLLKRLATISDEKAIPLFENLLMQEIFSPSVKIFFNAKLQELKALSAAQDNLN